MGNIKEPWSPHHLVILRRCRTTSVREAVGKGEGVQGKCSNNARRRCLRVPKAGTCWR